MIIQRRPQATRSARPALRGGHAAPLLPHPLYAPGRCRFGLDRRGRGAEDEFGCQRDDARLGCFPGEPGLQEFAAISSAWARGQSTVVKDMRQRGFEESL